MIFIINMTLCKCHGDLIYLLPWQRAETSFRIVCNGETFPLCSSFEQTRTISSKKKKLRDISIFWIHMDIEFLFWHNIISIYPYWHP